MTEPSEHARRVVLARSVEGLPDSWSQAPGMERLDQLLEHPKAAALIGGFRPDELHFIIHDIGLESCIDLLSHVTPEQWTGLVDFDGWRADRVDLARFQDWFEAALKNQLETAQALIQSADPEYLIVVLRGIGEVYTKDLELDEVPDSLEILTSPDFAFYVLIPRGHERISLVKQLLDVAYAISPDYGRKLLLACTIELPTALEETCFKFRSGRLADLGYPDPEHAVEALAVVDVPSFRARLLESLDSSEATGPVVSQDLAVHGMVLAAADRGPFLGEVLAVSSDANVAFNTAQALVYLAHRLLVATGADLGDPEANQWAHRRAVAHVSLGLERLAEGDPQLGSRILKKTWINDLHRVGHTLVHSLQQRARRVVVASGGASGYRLHESALMDLLEALADEPPRRVEGMDATGHPQRVFISSSEELHAVEEALFRAEVVVAWFEGALGFSLEALNAAGWADATEDDRKHIRFSALLLTLLANQTTGKGLVFEPVTSGGLDRFAQVILEEKNGRRVLRLQLIERLSEGLLPGETSGADSRARQHIHAFVQGCFEDFAAAVADVPPGEPLDPRALGGIVLHVTGSLGHG